MIQLHQKIAKEVFNMDYVFCYGILILSFNVLTIIIPCGTMEVQAASADGAKIAAVAQSYIGKKKCLSNEP